MTVMNGGFRASNPPQDACFWEETEASWSVEVHKESPDKKLNLWVSSIALWRTVDMP